MHGTLVAAAQVVDRSVAIAVNARRKAVKVFLALAIAVGGWGAIVAPQAAHAMATSKLAYITDFGTGSNDTSGPGSGSSIWVNAINGSPPLGSYTPSGGTPVVIADLLVSAVDAGGVAALSGFDTVMLYQVCDIGSHPLMVTALNSYLSTGLGKLIIYDGDRCSPVSGGTPDYSKFLFPFTSNNPGPLGATGSYTFVESNTLTPGLAVGPVNSTDALGDANTFATFDPNWCKSLVATTALTPSGGITEAYAQTGAGGLAIYQGEDNWFTFGPNAHQKTVFDNILNQQFKPTTGLPCGAVASGITLTPPSATNPVGGSHTVTATVTDTNGGAVAGVTVTFTVKSGPNAGKTGTGVTNAAGQATFTYTDTGGAGTDSIVATFTDPTGFVHTSNTATKTWVVPDRTPPLCALTKTIVGPPKAIQVTVQDPDGGLASIVVVTSTNAATVVPPFAPGTTSPVVVTSTKIDQTKSSLLALRVTDLAGNVTNCDPLLADSIAGKVTTVTIDGSERHLTIVNNGLSSMTIEVNADGNGQSQGENGQTFTLRGISGKTNLTLDISSALHAGSNSVTIRSHGPRGSSAMIVFSS